MLRFAVRLWQLPLLAVARVRLMPSSSRKPLPGSLHRVVAMRKHRRTDMKSLIAAHQHRRTTLHPCGIPLHRRPPLATRSFTSNTTRRTAWPSSAQPSSAASLAHSFTKLETERKV